MSAITISTGKVWGDAITEPALVSVIPENVTVKAPGGYYLEKKDPFAYTDNILIFKKNFCCDFYNGSTWLMFANREDLEFTPAECLDTGDTLQYGKDYYIYLVLDNLDFKLIVSLNSTYPDGYNANNSRKIGGFHYGAIRKISDDGEWVPVDSNGVKFGSSGTKWQDNVTSGIIPNSVWDLKNKPKNFMPGMAKVKDFWVSIYQMSVDEAVTFMSGTNGLSVADGLLKSSYGELPATGTEGLNQFNFNELARRQGMRLTYYNEWLLAAYGSPQGTDSGNNYGWTATGNTARTRTGCSVNTSTGEYSIGGVKPYAVSAYNICDCTGNVYEWQADYTIKQDSTSWGWQNVLGANMGQAYLPNADGMSALICGGYYNCGVHCGPRCVNLTNDPWHVCTDTGCRFACDCAA